MRCSEPPQTSEQGQYAGYKPNTHRRALARPSEALRGWGLGVALAVRRVTVSARHYSVLVWSI